jgi:hypothetical protein
MTDVERIAASGFCTTLKAKQSPTLGAPPFPNYCFLHTEDKLDVHRRLLCVDSPSSVDKPSAKRKICYCTQMVTAVTREVSMQLKSQTNIELSYCLITTYIQLNALLLLFKT